ncbi:hypothetical protein P3T73_12080 [Kiritimatiellota bacterium B12222]|nr:hypothetical protein P3T73_12080 [Kiritimatiellota bacterium B12222]
MNTTINQERFEVSKAYMDAVKSLRSFAEAHDLFEDPQIVAFDEEVFEAFQTFMTFRKSHPELKGYYEESDALFQQASEAKRAGDNEKYLQFIEQYSLVRKQLERHADTVPDLQVAQAEMDELSVQQLKLLAEKVSAINMEGEGIATQFLEIQLQFQELH